ncbi:phosphoribosyltransferase [Oscillatoria sp. FACHB-1407]|uniref:phosphoribosyltransferase n=1 Tax=Oscillatoria sp. FACHB-1407 TaxID=2692847 RepID=UPI001683211D|nr:phosphoribosyltransferase family protein [Oscillatoria sp. FACHB-1407]MBD2460061.1 phosphoribosyltransferase [Oscillatoria sp. FACHB-1407]
MAEFPLFHDRHDAGHQLAQAVLAELASLGRIQASAQPIVYALPKGGLPIAEPLAQLLHCPLDVVVAKKVTRPENPELAIGAVTADGHVIRSRQECFMQLDNGTWRSALQQAQTKAQEQLTQFESVRPQVKPQGAIAILVDDGIATGMTMAVAARALRAKRPARILICAPVAPKHMVQSLEHWGDRVIILASPESFFSVSRFYGEFHQVEMEEALECMKRGNQADPTLKS